MNVFLNSIIVILASLLFTVAIHQLAMMQASKMFLLIIIIISIVAFVFLLYKYPNFFGWILDIIEFFSK